MTVYADNCVVYDYDHLSTSCITRGNTGNTRDNVFLKIICNLKFVNNYTQPKLENVATDGDFKSTLSNTSNNEYLKNLFLEDQFSDVNLVTSCEKVLKAHKCILSAVSPTFAAMFKHDMLENKSNIVNIPDVDNEVLKQMLRFIYIGQVENMETIASGLFIAADKYNIEDLKTKCEKYIVTTLQWTMPFQFSSLQINIMQSS